MRITGVNDAVVYRDVDILAVRTRAIPGHLVCQLSSGDLMVLSVKDAAEIVAGFAAACGTKPAFEDLSNAG
jgi:hypothetical protein